MSPDTYPALLTNTEFGNIHVSYAYQRKIKSDIKKKIRILQELELPLLIEKGLSPKMQVLRLIVTVSQLIVTMTQYEKPIFFLLFAKQGSLGRDLDPGPLPYQGNALPG